MLEKNLVSFSEALENLTIVVNNLCEKLEKLGEIEGSVEKPACQKTPSVKKVEKKEPVAVETAPVEVTPTEAVIGETEVLGKTFKTIEEFRTYAIGLTSSIPDTTMVHAKLRELGFDRLSELPAKEWTSFASFMERLASKNA